MTAADEILKARTAQRGAIKALVALDAEIDRELVEALMSNNASISAVDYLDLEKDSKGKDGGAEVLLVGCMGFSGAVRDFMRGSRERHPARPIVLLSPLASDGFLRQAFEAGADDLLTVPVHADPELLPDAQREIVFAIEKALARKRGSPGTSPQELGRMICVLGLKGGSGKTLVSANLAVALALAGHSVAVLDLDLQFGDIGLAMGIPPEQTLYDLVRSGGSVDAEKLEDFLGKHPSGVDVLLSPVQPDLAGFVTPDFLRGVQRVLRESHEFLVIDTPPGLTPEVIGAIDASTDVLMVAMRDSLSLKNTKLGLETLERMEYDRRKVRLLLNRANTDVGIEKRDLETVLGREFDISVPSSREITLAVNRGEPIALDRRSEAGKAFRQLARLYGDEVTTLNGQPTVRTARGGPIFRRKR